MKTTIRLLIFALVVVGLTSTAMAASLSLEPASSSAVPRGSVSLELVISGLGDSAAPSLGDFDIDIGFDPGALTFSGYTLGDMLGDVGLFEALDASFGEFAPGSVNLAEVSFLTDGELDAMQGDRFVLATLEFLLTGLAAGESTMLTVSGVLALGDASGTPIAVDGVAGATITAIPLPAAFWLLAGALLALRRCSKT